MPLGVTQEAEQDRRFGPSGSVLLLCSLSRRTHTPKLHPGCMLDSFGSCATHEGAIHSLSSTYKASLSLT